VILFKGGIFEKGILRIFKADIKKDRVELYLLKK